MTRRPLSLALVGLVAAGLSGTAAATWNPPDVDLTRPRILFRPGDVQQIQARLARPPYQQLARVMDGRIRQAEDIALDDHTIGSERIKARAAKNLAFFYAVERRVSYDFVLPFASEEDRAAAGARVRDLLVNMYTRSRLAVAAPLGGWDRDINTSEELLQYATAYDAMRGAGYDFGADEATIVTNIADLAAELYDNYRHPETASNFATLHQNNHRSKTGAALVVAGVALAEYAAAPGTDPRGVRDPAAWIAYGLDLVDLILRWALVTGDGAYGEGPFYMRYTAQNVLPFARAWDRLVGGRDWEAHGLLIPSLWRHPLFLRTHQWLLDLTVPDGSLAPIDDGNPGRAYYFGAAPADPTLAPAAAWRWANAPTLFDTDGNVDVSADAIAAYDDAVAPAPPAGSATAFYVEGGNAAFRSDWSAEAVYVLVLGEHDTASEFGRDRNGLGVTPESHEHAEPGAYLLHAFGERLALDPGYFDFTNRTLVNQPRHHNLILIDGHGPVDYLGGSIAWASDLAGRPPVDGHASLSAGVDSGVADAVTVTSRYGQPANRSAIVSRRFHFADDRYLVIADTVAGPRAPAANHTWLVHGDGGGDSGGDFESTPVGGRWTRPLARLDAAFAFDAGAPTFATDTAVHEGPNRQQQTHTVLEATVAGRNVRALELLYPTRANAAPPSATALPIESAAALVLIDNDGDRRALALHRAAPQEPPLLLIPASQSGLREAATDGVFALFDAQLDGPLRLAWSEHATELRYGGVRHLAAASRGTLGICVGTARAEVVADNSDTQVTVGGLPFVPRTADGACGLDTTGGEPMVRLGRERRFVLRADVGNAQPAADPGADRRVGIGEAVTLDGSASCDADADPLTPRWTLVSAPAGSAWSLTGDDQWTPELLTDRPGPFRLRLVVTDRHGAASRPAEVLIVAGARCADGRDDDLDGLFDEDDPDCDAVLTPASLPCGGDCMDDGAVTVAELVRCVRIALGLDAVGTCAACDTDGSGEVQINDLVSNVGYVLNGCPG